MKGIIKAVNISEIKGVCKHPVPSVECVENLGIKNDAHAAPGIRQISLLGIESINKFRQSKIVVGLCEGKFAENFTTEGIVLYELPVGTRLKIGDTIQEVSQIGKKCHADQGCEIAKLYGQCIMPKEGIFTIVIKGGIVKAGDAIEVID